MIRYLAVVEVLNLHRQIIEQSGGTLGIPDLGILKSAVAQPKMTFGGEDLIPHFSLLREGQIELSPVPLTGEVISNK
jgi:prophage maintenance system killer protein